ncbi:C-Myc-binding protein [Carpediemonas membranifera]|uniref:c-Myc-binding protein n=1 Tax=Carpediemonas membranifera TaxID=201153 RepID=A0A8J6E2U4_9EUKA|nr:C-Myc-binding protein [Carpediemonas membranifera]|eukprot:KAG9394751.1 C-Myc-binding protein [Carpediemonas membranifera]
MSSYQTPDAKKEEFRKYLDRNGVIDTVTKVLVALYEEPERPPNALEFVKQYLCSDTEAKLQNLETQVADLKRRNAELEEELEAARKT